MPPDRRAADRDEAIRTTAQAETNKTSVEKIWEAIESVWSAINKLKVPVYGLCVLFTVGGVLFSGMRDDAKDLHTKIDRVREDHIKENRELVEKLIKKIDTLQTTILELHDG